MILNVFLREIREDQIFGNTFSEVHDLRKSTRQIRGNTFLEKRCVCVVPQHTVNADRNVALANLSVRLSISLSLRHTPYCIKTNAHIVKLFLHLVGEGP